MNMTANTTNLRKLGTLVTVMGLSLALGTGCSRPKKADADGADSAAGAAGQDSTPQIADKDISTDPMGSDSGKINGLATVFFEYDKAALTSDARQKLAANAAWIKGNGNYTIQIEGHTDERGSVEYNLALGERRAKSVKSYLEGLGVASNRMTIISYGEEKPLVSGDSESAWSKNRRANFVPLQ